MLVVTYASVVKLNVNFIRVWNSKSEWLVEVMVFVKLTFNLTTETDVSYTVYGCYFGAIVDMT